MTGSLELVRGEDLREIDERASDGRDLQAVALAYDVIEGIQCAAAVHPQLSRRRAPAQGGDVELPGWQRTQIPHRGGGQMT